MVKKEKLWYHLKSFKAISKYIQTFLCLRFSLHVSVFKRHRRYISFILNHGRILCLESILRICYPPKKSAERSWRHESKWVRYWRVMEQLEDFSTRAGVDGNVGRTCWDLRTTLMGEGNKCLHRSLRHWELSASISSSALPSSLVSSVMLKPSSETRLTTIQSTQRQSRCLHPAAL